MRSAERGNVSQMLPAMISKRLEMALAAADGHLSPMMGSYGNDSYGGRSRPLKRASKGSSIRVFYDVVNALASSTWRDMAWYGYWVKTHAEERYHRAHLAGASSFNREEWDALVKRAADRERDRMNELRVACQREYPHHVPSRDRQICGPGQVPIDLRTILAAEAHLAECEMLHDRLVELGASEELSFAMREQLISTLTRAKASIKARLKQEQRSHLSVVDDG